MHFQGRGFKHNQKDILMFFICIPLAPTGFSKLFPTTFISIRCTAVFNRDNETI